ncbi:hypothetical protein AMECASPLE_032571 [Ameca splendens]|uniref:Uncharacterized protein n=1 Tax=Ameca splendens TaxID=208324 RepID=A0ABV0Z5F8_9TELE
MLRRVTRTTPCRSSCESPFLSYLQPCVSETTLWKHQTFAHLPVHPPMPCALLKHNNFWITRKEHQPCEPPRHSTCLLQQTIIHHQHASSDPSGRSSLHSTLFVVLQINCSSCYSASVIVAQAQSW